VADQQQPALGRDGLQRRQRVLHVEVARQRLVHAEQGTPVLRPAGSRQLGRLASPDLGAEQHEVEAHVQARQGRPRRSRLLLPSLGQAALEILAGAVRLGLRMSQ